MPTQTAASASKQAKLALGAFVLRVSHQHEQVRQ
jgi:hypothetical protein